MIVEHSLAQAAETSSSSLVEVLRLALREEEGATVALVVLRECMEGAGQMIGVLVRGRMLGHLREG